MFYYEGTMQIEQDDQCWTCKFAPYRNPHSGKESTPEKNCPLLEALYCGIVESDGEFAVSNCDFYIDKRPHLQIVAPIDFNKSAR